MLELQNKASKLHFNYLFRQCVETIQEEPKLKFGF